MKTNIPGLYDHALNWLMAYGPRIIAAIIILGVGEWLIRLLKKKIKRQMQRRNYHSALQPFFQNLVLTSLQVLLLFVVMQIIGVQLTIFTAIVAAFGAAAGFALSGTLQNFASGVLILLLKPFDIGDNIIAQGQEGTVTAIRLFYSIIKTYDNRTVVVPNSKLSNEIIINITTEGRRRLDIELEFDMKTDIDKVKKMIQESVDESKDILDDPKLRIGVASLSKDKYTLSINVWLNAHGFEDARLLFQERLLHKLSAAGAAPENKS
ncbi:mechanosensitive ion channel family protein [Chitinophagaceae bacterium MMS25-I14]